MYQHVINDLHKYQNKQRAIVSQRFFKTGVGEYGEGDVFWGLSVPQIRIIAKKYKDIERADIEKLLAHETHEARLCAVLIMVHQAKQQPEKMYHLYLKNTKYINNWDLVDTSAEYVLGNYLRSKDKSILYTLAKSKSIWERRMAIMATFHEIKQGNYAETFQIAEQLLHDGHDLIQKAVGWMLREVGKKISLQVEEIFLEKYAATMPRTMLRYALEHFPTDKKNYYMQLKHNKAYAKNDSA